MKRVPVAQLRQMKLISTAREGRPRLICPFARARICKRTSVHHRSIETDADNRRASLEVHERKVWQKGRNSHEHFRRMNPKNENNGIAVGPEHFAQVGRT
jgi:SLT domain-containing protein